jgi:hypothetical protein
MGPRTAGPPSKELAHFPGIHPQQRSKHINVTRSVSLLHIDAKQLTHRRTREKNNKNNPETLTLLDANTSRPSIHELNPPQKNDKRQKRTHNR